MALSETIQYVVIIGITIVFSVLGFILEKKGKYFKFVAAFCWFISAMVNFISGFSAGAVTFALSFLYAAFGLIFSAAGISDIFQEKRIDRENVGI